MAHSNQNDEEQFDNETCFCTYCKGQIDSDDLVIKKKKSYHRECWKIEHNHIDELKFE